MNFVHPSLIWFAALLLPGLALFFWWSWRVRQRLISRFVPRRLQEALALGLSPRRVQTRAALLLAVVLALLVALARPQGGSTTIEATQRALDILVAIDTSRSMLAEDAGPGVTRLQAAQLAALDLSRLARRDRLGLIAFAGSAFLQCPLTVDERAFEQSIAALDTDIIPEGGTALGPAINTAVEAAGEEDNIPVLVLFTDGEEHEAGAAEAADRAAKAGLRVFTVGVGTARGEIVRIRGADEATYLKDSRGNVVKSSLNEPLLRDIAEKTGGVYLPLQGARAMAELFSRQLEPLPRKETRSRLFEQREELFQWPLVAALVLLLFETLLPEYGRARGEGRPARHAHPTLGNLALLMGVALLMGQHPSLASAGNAYRSYEDGDYGEALAEYERLARKSPGDARLHFNAGAAAYRARQYSKAAEHFSDALRSPDLELQQSAYYNLGNARFSEGEAIPDPASRSQAWEQAIRNYEAALSLNTDDGNARHNLEYVRKRLEELRQQQQQQEKSQKQNENQQQNSDDDQEGDSQDNQQSKDSQEDQNSDEKPSEPPPGSSSQPDPDQEQQSQKPGSGPQADQPEEPQDPSRQASSGPSGSPDPSQQQANPETDSASGSPGESVPESQMSRQEALRVLDAARAEEKPLSPPKKKGRGRVVKDW